MSKPWTYGESHHFDSYEKLDFFSLSEPQWDIKQKKIHSYEVSTVITFREIENK